MTEIPISPQIWKLAEAILTEKQKTVLELREKRGYSWNQLAITFNCTRANVREHHAAATRNMLNAIDAAGGDIDLALEQAMPDSSPGDVIAAYDDGTIILDDGITTWNPERAEAFVTAGGKYQPRPASEETPEEKDELDRLWKESA